MEQIIQDWAGVIGSVLGTGAIIYTWLTRGSRDNAKALKELRELIANDLKDLDGRVTKHGERISVLEQEVKHLPDAQFVNNLQLALEKMAGDIKAMAVTTASTSQSVERLETWAFAQK